MFRERSLRALLLICASLLLRAQGPPPAAEPLSASQVKGMHQSGISDAQTINVIQQTPPGYSLSTTEVDDLIHSGVSDRVIEAMYARTAAGAGGRGGGAGGNAGGGAPVLAPFPPAANEGIFFAKGTSWLPILDERVRWTQKSSMNRVRQVTSAGTTRGSVRGVLDNESSKTLVSNPPNIVINLPAGSSIGDFHLVQLALKKGQRRVDLGSASKVDTSHKSLDYKIEAAQNGAQYKISLPGGLMPGEYGIFRYNTVHKEGVGKMYTFQIQ